MAGTWVLKAAVGDTSLRSDVAGRATKNYSTLISDHGRQKWKVSERFPAGATTGCVNRVRFQRMLKRSERASGCSVARYAAQKSLPDRLRLIPAPIRRSAKPH